MVDGKRNMQQVQQEYQRACAQAGQAQYQIRILEEELRKLNRELRALNKEAARLSAKEPKQAEVASEQQQPS